MENRQIQVQVLPGVLSAVDSLIRLFLVWLTESERRGPSREGGLPGSLSDVSVSWNQRLPNRAILPVPGSKEGEDTHEEINLLVILPQH